jgi:M6 family metalloprotease-like protein
MTIKRALQSWLTIALLITIGASDAFAISASPKPFAVEQPDGEEITLQMRGDEYFHWLEDVDGFTVIRHDGWFVYGLRGANGEMEPTDLKPGRDNPQAFALTRGERPSAAVQNRTRALMADGQGGGTSAPAATTTSGQLKNLVVLMRFSNHATRVLPSVSNFDVLMNAVGGDPVLAPTGSVRDYYQETSYGILTLDSTVVAWIDLPNTEAYYANGDSGLTTKTHEALKYALDVLDNDPTFSFLDFDQDGDNLIDAITFLHSGYGAEWGGTSADGANYLNRIWSHKWAISPYPGWTGSEGVRVYEYHISPGIWGTSGSAIGRIGVICHETGHFLGLPDLYDTDSAGSGIGSYGLMANSWGFDSSQKYPPLMCAWSKITLGWLTPTLITGAGSFTLNQSQATAEAYRINLGYPSNEYLLIENRQPVGFEAVMPQGGLAIFHIDDQAGFNTEGYPGQAGWPGNGNHYRVALLQADGNYNLERGNNRGDSGDVYHAAGVSELGPNTTPNTDAYQSGNIIVTDNRVYNISAAGSSMTFDFEVISALTPPAAPNGLVATADSFERIDLAWNDQSNNETTFKIERSLDGSTWAQIDTTGADVTGYADLQVEAETTYHYRVRAANAAGDSAYSNVSQDTTDPQPDQIFTYADQDQAVAGNVSGTYANTLADDGVVQTITEHQSGGKPSNRYSYLDHRWRFQNVNAGVAVTLFVQGWAEANSENDDFVIQYSTDGGSTWQYAGLILQGTPANNVMTAELPPETRGIVWLRVTDTDATSGNRTLDSVSIDELVIVSELDPNDIPPVPPTNLTAVALSASQVHLGWTDASDNERGFDVYRSTNAGATFSLVGSTPTDATSYLDGTVSPGITYTYQVGAFSLSWESLSETVDVATPDGIALSANGRKRRGKVEVDLTWSTGPTISSVTVMRSYNGAPFEELVADLANNGNGSYTDRTEYKNGSFRYFLTGPGGTPQSNEVEVNY